MIIHTLRARFSAALESAGLALRPWRKRDIEKQAHKADLRDWENEGGNLAPLPEVPKTIPTTGLDDRDHGRADPPIALACTAETIRLNRFAISGSGPIYRSK
jgi:hypothetical protein